MQPTTSRTLLEHFRCPESFASFELQDGRGSPGYFRLGDKTIGFGRTSVGPGSETPDGELVDVGESIVIGDSRCFLPFDPDEIVENLHRERYVSVEKESGGLRGLGKKAYYALRPVLPFAVRSRLKMVALRGWENKPFPKWPLDRTADRTLEQVLAQAMRARGVEKVPFIWFWPKGHSSAIVMTHDVEAQPGLEFCSSLMDLNDRCGIKSSFQFVPEGRYTVPEKLLEEVRRRGFEVNVHDWNHDGFLFSTRLVFLERVKKINQIAAKWAAEGFRGGALYRNQEWFDDFNLAYDLSVPNVGHLDPQPGGCCSLLPYFVGRMLEIPLTCAQDYMLFHMLNEYSIDTWKRQVDTIVENHGLASFIVHPDYILEERPRAVYSELLAHLASVGAKQNAWIVPPGRVNRWWRDRSRMVLVEDRGSWKIEGPGKEEACVAYATVKSGELVYELAQDTKLHAGQAMSEALS